MMAALELKIGNNNLMDFYFVAQRSYAGNSYTFVYIKLLFYALLFQDIFVD